MSANGGKEPRGIRGYSITGGGTTFKSWKLQGNLVLLSHRDKLKQSNLTITTGGRSQRS